MTHKELVIRLYTTVHIMNTGLLISETMMELEKNNRVECVIPDAEGGYTSYAVIKRGEDHYDWIEVSGIPCSYRGDSPDVILSKSGLYLSE